MPRKKKVESKVTTELVTITPKEPAKKEPRVFEYKRLSASMMKLWLQCKRKFHLHYIEGLSEPPNISFTLGTGVHSALEAANKAMVAKPRKFNPFEMDEFIQVFRDFAAKSYASDMGIFTLGEGIIKSELTKMDPKDKIIGIEKEFDIVTDEGVRIYGFMDKVEEVDSNTIRIIDYKTSNMAISFEEAKTDPQLALYDLACSIMYPQYQNRIMELRYLKLEESVVITKSEIERHNFKLQLVSVDKAIKDYMANYKKSTERPRGEMNEFCNWCSFKGNCSEYVNAITSNLPEFIAVHELDDQKFLNLWTKMKAVEKATETTIDQLKTWAIQRIESDPTLSITDGKNEIWSLTTTRREYDPIVVAKAIGLESLLGAETGKPMFKISNEAMVEYLKVTESKRIRKKIEEATTIKFNNPQIRIRKVKDAKK